MVEIKLVSFRCLQDESVGVSCLSRCSRTVSIGPKTARFLAVVTKRCEVCEKSRNFLGQGRYMGVDEVHGEDEDPDSEQ